jgi:hypothetical protein
MFVSQHLFSDAVTTFDNKLLLVGGFWDGIWRSHAYKLNSDLEYDTLYSYPFVYDSLCPYPIASDTIPMDCVVVGINDPINNPDQETLKVYPNPVSDILHIEIPNYLKTELSNQVFNIITVYYQWHSVFLGITDLFGRNVYSKEIPQSDHKCDINVSGWDNGIYIIRLTYNHNTIATCKFVKK